MIWWNVYGQRCNIIDQFNESKITPAKFYLIHPFEYGIGKICNIQFANDDKLALSRDKNEKTNNIKWIFVVLNAPCSQKIEILN